MVINDLLAAIRNSFSKGSHAYQPVIYLPRRLFLGGLWAKQPPLLDGSEHLIADDQDGCVCLPPCMSPGPRDPEGNFEEGK